MDSYRIPTGNGASEYVEKRSRFLGLVQPVRSEDEAREIIAACKKQYHDARHNCWCYLLRDGTERYSDDGEPQGTAGIPMLEVFRRAGVTNVVCVVTRYFGGVLLGTLAAIKRGKASDTVAMIIALLGVSVPSFVVASILQYFLGLKLYKRQVSGNGHAPFRRYRLGRLQQPYSPGYRTRLRFSRDDLPSDAYQHAGRSRSGLHQDR